MMDDHVFFLGFIAGMAMVIVLLALCYGLYNLFRIWVDKEVMLLLKKKEEK